MLVAQQPGCGITGLQQSPAHIWGWEDEVWIGSHL